MSLRLLLLLLLPVLSCVDITAAIITADTAAFASRPVINLRLPGARTPVYRPAVGRSLSTRLPRSTGMRNYHVSGIVLRTAAQPNNNRDNHYNQPIVDDITLDLNTICKQVEKYLSVAQPSQLRSISLNHRDLLNCLTDHILQSSAGDLYGLVSTYLRSAPSTASAESLMAFIERVAVAGKIGLLRLSLNSVKQQLRMNPSDLQLDLAFVKAVAAKQFYTAAKLHSFDPSIDSLAQFCPNGRPDFQVIFDAVRRRVLTDNEALKCASEISSGADSPNHWASKWIRQLVEENCDDVLKNVDSLPEPLMDYIKYGADWSNPLHYACAVGDDELVQLLLERGERTRRSFSILHRVIHKKAEEFALSMLRQCRDVCTADRHAIAKLVGALGVPLDQNAMRLAIENGHIHIARRLLESVGGDNNSEKVVVVAAAYQQAVKHRSIDLIRILIWRWNQPLSVGIASMLLDYLVRHSTTAEVDEAFAMAEKQIELDKNFYLPSQIFAAVVDNTDPAEAVSIIRLLTDKYGLIVATGKNGGWAALRKASTKGIDYYTIVVELISHLSVDTNGLQGLALYSITGTTSGTMSDARFAVCNQILMDYGSAIAGDKLTVGGLLRRAIGDSNIEGVFAITRHPSINSCILVEALDSLPLLINDDRIRKEEGQVYIIQDVRLRSLLRRQFNDGAAFKSIDADVEGDDDRSSSSKSAAAILNYLESCLRLPDNKDSP